MVASAPSTDTDHILVSDAEKLVKCSRQTLYRLVEAGKLSPRFKVEMRDTWDRVAHRSALVRSELLSLFVKRPAKGQPVKLLDGTNTPYYLRDDFKERFACSDIVLSYYSKKRSKLRTGPVLRRKKFLVIGDRGRGRPKELTAWRADDWQNVIDGLEGPGPQRCTGPWAKRYRSAQRTRAMNFFEQLKTPIDAETAFRLGRQHKIPRWLYYVAMEASGVKAVRQGRGNGRALGFTLVRNGESRETVHAETASEPPASDRAQTPKRRGRGREQGYRDPHAQARAGRLIEDFRTGQFATIAALARHHHMTRGRASQIIKEAREKALI